MWDARYISKKFEITIRFRLRPAWRSASRGEIACIRYPSLISGEFIEVLQIGFFALFGIYATNALIQWYSEGPIGVVTAPLLVLGAIGAYWPLALLPNLAGAALVVGVIVWTSRTGKSLTLKEAV